MRGKKHDLPPPGVIELYAKLFPKNKNLVLDYLAKQQELEEKRERRLFIRDISAVAIVGVCVFLAAYFLWIGKVAGLAFLGVPVMGAAKAMLSSR